jgi:hypothetical protein
MSASTEIRGGIEVRKINGAVDEIVCDRCSFHLEQMDNGHWWIGIDTPGGQSLHINLSTRMRVLSGRRSDILAFAQFQ